IHHHAQVSTFCSWPSTLASPLRSSTTCTSTTTTTPSPRFLAPWILASAPVSRTRRLTSSAATTAVTPSCSRPATARATIRPSAAITRPRTH
ncbi:hypothetical protein BG000_001527, partial [Podila horticola]